MKLERVIDILEKHQEWRRDKNVPPKVEMQSPTELGAAIDYALIELKKLRLSDISVAFDEGYDLGYKDATSEACKEIEKNYRPNER